MEQEDAPAGGRVRSKAPDWVAIRDDYERTLDTKAALARRHGVAPGTLASRIERHHWHRGVRADDDETPMAEAIVDMTRDMRRMMNSLLRRGDRLIQRCEKEGGTLDEQLTLHERNVAMSQKLVRMMERFATLAERAAATLPVITKERSYDEARREFEGRLASIGRKFEALADSGHADAG